MYSSDPEDMFEPIVTSDGRAFPVHLCEVRESLGKTYFLRVMGPDGRSFGFTVTFPLSFMAKHNLSLNGASAPILMARAREEVRKVIEETQLFDTPEIELDMTRHAIRCLQ
jgi:hypothetical protein